MADALVGCGEAKQAATLLDEALPVAIERSFHREVTLIQELAGSLQPR